MKYPADQGMTMLELMVAVMLLAVFMAGFVGITEFTSALTQGINQNDSPDNAFKASDLILARSTTGERLNELARDLSILPEPALPKDCLKSNTSWNIHASSTSSKIWYLKNEQLTKFLTLANTRGFIDRVCLYNKYRETSSLPGLYVLQAEPKQAGPLIQPLRVLFCRPQKFCMQ
ncbi:prepilin-type N-terminal cleavage/methylation domain-containing protein [Synechococcus sp. UW140]|uniref:prepilin-type N-terminal cleavage/methylation domain-containing protein n=1 Tax=Synechococcus sp. UW140 TaxID=368503 RepID=UPI0031377BE2